MNPPINKIECGDCLEVLGSWPDNSVPTIITDPPYGLGFMGKEWDTFTGATRKNPPRKGDFSSVQYDNANRKNRGKGWSNSSYAGTYDHRRNAEFQAWFTIWAKECLRIAKPGAFLLCFGGTRTYHRLTCAIEDAGWQIRDCLMWLYGSGFPKSHDISKAIDKAKGIWRGKAGKVISENAAMSAPNYERTSKGSPNTDLAQLWDGYGTALKPAWEPIVVAMKPLDGTFAQNAEKWKVAGLNIDGARIPCYNTNDDKTYNKEINYVEQKSNSKFSGNKDGKGNSVDSLPNMQKTIPDSEMPLESSQETPDLWAKMSSQVNKRDKQLQLERGEIHRPTGVCPSKDKRGKFIGTQSSNGKPFAEKAKATGDCPSQKQRHDRQQNRKSGIDSKCQRSCNRQTSSGAGQENGAIQKAGRWPSNVILSPEAARMLDQQSGVSKSSDRVRKNNQGWGDGIRYGKGNAQDSFGFSDSGGCSRFFYCAKASKAERNAGCEGLEEKHGIRINAPRANETIKTQPRQNHHPTCKPLALMEYLCKLTKTPTGGLVLDPFGGSGTTAIACINTSRDFVLIEKDAEYCEIAEKRVEYWRKQKEARAGQMGFQFEGITD